MAHDEALERYRLIGDEDCGVGLECRDCERGGKPIAYYAGISSAYTDDPDVAQCTAITHLIHAAHDHTKAYHSA